MYPDGPLSTTRLVMRPLRKTERVLNNADVERLLATARELGDKISFPARALIA